jgi:hypothetical protein
LRPETRCHAAVHTEDGFGSQADSRLEVGLDLFDTRPQIAALFHVGANATLERIRIHAALEE